MVTDDTAEDVYFNDVKVNVVVDLGNGLNCRPPLPFLSHSNPNSPCLKWPEAVPPTIPSYISKKKCQSDLAD